MNKELLLECFTQLKGKAASGIDNITKEKYAVNLNRTQGVYPQTGQQEAATTGYPRAGR